MKIMICGGGTGGHIYPALAVVDVLRQRELNNSDLLWVGTHGQMETELVPRAGIPLQTIAGGPIAGVGRLEQARNGLKLVGSVGTALQLIGRFRPDVLLLTGGYVNLPVALAARLRGVPAAVYLPDVEPGAAIKRVAPLVQKIACTTDGSRAFLPAEKLVVTGYPVRAELRAALAQTPAAARQAFDLAPERPTLFVFGGSRGAQTINQALLAILPDLLPEAQVIHISGTLTWEEVAAAADRLDPALRRSYRPFPYLHEQMGQAFRAADLVVARAGASMLGEGPAFGVPAILVPYPWAWRYQKVNADFLTERGAGVRLDDDRLATDLLPLVRSLLFDRTRLAAMKSAAAALDVPESADRIADVLTGLAANRSNIALLQAGAG